MPRSLKRGLVVIGSSLALVIVGMVWWVVGSVDALAARDWPLAFNFGSNPSAVGLSSGSYCSTWEFMNNTGQDVDGLRFRLKGVKSVSSIYTGTMNPFGDADGTSGYDAVADAYRLNFSGVSVLDSDQIQIGFCSDAATLRLDSTASWTVSGTVAPPSPFFSGLEWNWLSPTHLQVRVVNEQNVTMTLFALNLLDAGDPLSLDDLNEPTISNLSLALDLLSDAEDIAPKGEKLIDIYFDSAPSANHIASLGPNHPYVLEAVLADTDDPGNNVRLYAQGLSPSIPVYLPLVVR